MTKFGDIDAAKAKANLNARVKTMLMLLFQMFSGSRQNTADKIHNFIPHLKRTDRDCGSLPFFSKTFTSHKTNKEHILLTMISMVVQTYWDRIDDKKILDLKLIEEFEDVLNVLEEISKDSIDNFGVYPVSNLHFSLMSKENLDKIEAEDAKKELAEAEQREEQEQKARADEAEGKKLMAAELGSDDSTSQDSPSTQSDETAEAGTEELGKQSAGDLAEQQDSHESEDTPKTGGGGSGSDEVSAEDADNCEGDCDNCDNPGCQTNQTDAIELADDHAEVEELLEGQNTEPTRSELSDENVDVVIAAREDNLEGNVPGSLADENGGEVNDVPPMPEEEKTDDDGDSQEAVVS
jgi:hypothetical protein